MKKLLLIGGSGAIGQELLHCFDQDRYELFWTDSKQFPLPRRITWPFPWGDIDIVVNLAAVTTNEELYKPNIRNEDVILVNCLGAVDILNAFLPYMQLNKYGRIIMMSSVFSEINIVGQGVYSASKAFVDKLVKIAAIENAQYGITINSIQLGYTGIGMGALTTENKEKAIRKIAMRKFCPIIELHHTIEYIIESEYLTGQNIRLDGGVK